MSRLITGVDPPNGTLTAATTSLESASLTYSDLLVSGSPSERLMQSIRSRQMPVVLLFASLDNSTLGTVGTRLGREGSWSTTRTGPK